ncbi:hypothetical protein ACFPES_01900 [Paenibacillus sp. GCM10023248]|uniref:Uncharacterized protein n=1 Tax=Paenibacillus aceris TaxID=869555 RepID=A0ABS4HZC2_9BACL|nr:MULTISPECIES: hypothetical protein [Bacillales]MBP1963546.1 hypothetical protein [Paenibacillus aceris]MDD9265777.1 hypothetical protein [Paenibacillus sp. MAHUQ-63]MDR6879018.1 hypothetical protein [Bacillus sp. 3255]NHW36810.1 hypothetical protein [Paenibacillus aceris]
MQPSNLYVSEKLMQWQQHDLEVEARELWKFKSIKKRKVYMMITSLFFFV